MNFNPMKNETDKERDKRIERKIVARLSRGNLSLRQGRYITSEDIERVRKKNREWKFDEK
jgi:hypothetical protein